MYSPTFLGNKVKAGINWLFTTNDVGIRRKRLYSSLLTGPCSINVANSIAYSEI